MSGFNPGLHPRAKNGKFRRVGVPSVSRGRRAVIAGSTLTGAALGAVVGSPFGLSGSVGFAITGGRTGAIVGRKIRSGKKK